MNEYEAAPAAAIGQLRKALNSSGFQGETGGPPIGEDPTPSVQLASLSLIEALRSYIQTQGPGAPLSDTELDDRVLAAFRSILSELSDVLPASWSPARGMTKSLSLEAELELQHKYDSPTDRAAAREEILDRQAIGLEKTLMKMARAELNKGHYGAPQPHSIMTPEVLDEAWGKYDSKLAADRTPVKKHIDGLDTPAVMTKGARSRQEARETLARARKGDWS